MPTYTDNHDLQIFASGEAPWEHGSDMQTIDGRLPIVDLDANKANYNPKNNALFFASDTGTFYRGDGTSWIATWSTAVDNDGVEVYADVSRLDFGNDLGVTDNGNGSVTVNSTASASSGGSHNWIDVTQSPYSADNTGTNDASAAIQQALNDAGAGAVFVPQGTYQIATEIKLNATNNGVSLVGEGYGSHLRGTGTNTNSLVIEASNNPLRNITVDNLRFSNADYSNVHAHWQSHDDSYGVALTNLWSHDSGRGVLLGTPNSYADGIRVWNCSHNGFSFTGSTDTQYGHSTKTWPTDIQRRWVNNIVAWNNDANGIDLSKQACLCTNFVSRQNASGMKFSNYTTGGSMLANGWLIENGGDGMRDTTGGTYGATISMDRVYSLRNGQDPLNQKADYGPGKGFDLRNARYQIGSIYAGGNADTGVHLDGCPAAIQSIVTENNGGAGVRGTAGNEVDIFHLAGSGNTDGLTAGTGFGDGGVWVCRSRDYAGAQHPG